MSLLADDKVVNTGLASSGDTTKPPSSAGIKPTVKDSGKKPESAPRKPELDSHFHMDEDDSDDGSGDAKFGNNFDISDGEEDDNENNAGLQPVDCTPRAGEHKEGQRRSVAASSLPIDINFGVDPITKMKLIPLRIDEEEERPFGEELYIRMKNLSQSVNPNNYESIRCSRPDDYGHYVDNERPRLTKPQFTKCNIPVQNFDINNITDLRKHPVFESNEADTETD